MSGPTLTIAPSSHRFEPITPASAPEVFEHMEATQAKIDPRKMEADLTPAPLKNIPMPLQRQALEVADEICKKTKQTSLTRRLSILMARVAEAAERYIFQKKEKQHKRKVKIEDNLQLQQDWKSYQAWTQSGGGFGSAFLAISGNLIGGPVGEVLTGISHLSPKAAEALSTWMDGKQLPLQHEQQFFLNTVGSDKQTIEGLKNLPRELQQLVQKLLDLELQACRAVSQR